MQSILLASVWHYFFGFLLFFIAVFLIGLILLQRGRGGGLTGALGGAGGQSAFGSKTGDVFTKVTIGAAFVWIVVCLAADKVLVTTTNSVFGTTEGSSTIEKSSTDKSGGTGGATDGVQGDKSGDGAKSDDASSETPAKDDGAGSIAPEAEKTPDAEASSDKSEPKADDKNASDSPTEEK